MKCLMPFLKLCDMKRLVQEKHQWKLILLVMLLICCRLELSAQRGRGGGGGYRGGSGGHRGGGAGSNRSAPATRPSGGSMNSGSRPANVNNNKAGGGNPGVGTNDRQKPAGGS